MTNHFTTGVKESISYSAEEAGRTNSPVISAAHLLLGLLRVQDEAIIRWRAGLGARLRGLTIAVETMIQTANQYHAAVPPKSVRWFVFGRKARSGKLPLDKDAERIIRGSSKEAPAHQDVEPRHLMLAILHDKGSMLASVLRQFAIDDSGFKHL
jgi:ATP-dependent Clp protease ATP-binding subunit ClpA